MDFAKAWASASERFKICRAKRCAVFGPTPGNFCSCSIKRASGGV